MNENMELYKYFYAVAQTGNISAAAKQLYTSQPVVSKYIGRLENELHTQLFIRTSRGVRLTDEGRLLYEHVESAFDAIAAGRQELERIHRFGIGNIRFGVSTTLCKYMLLPYLRTYIKQHPHVRLSIQCQSTNQTLELLEKNKIDIGLIGEPRDFKGIRFFTVSEIEDVFVSAGSYLKNLETMAYTESIYENATVMMLDQENLTRQYIDSCLKPMTLLYGHILEVSTMDLIIDFAKIGMGIGCVIKNFVQDEIESGALVKVPIAPPIPKRLVGFAVKNQPYVPAPVRSFLKMVSDEGSRRLSQ